MQEKENRAKVKALEKENPLQQEEEDGHEPPLEENQWVLVPCFYLRQ